MAIVNSNNLIAPVQQWYDEVLLAMEVPRTIHAMGAKRKSMPGNNSKIIRQERYHRLPTATTPLGDSGLTPEGELMDSEFINIELGLYASYTRITEQHEKTTQSPVLNQRARLLGIQKKETEDELLREMLSSTASFVSCSGGVNGDVPTEIEATDVQKIVDALKSYDANTMDSREDASDKFGTASVAASYFALGHVNLNSTISSISGFTQVKDYANYSKVKPSELGAAYYTRFFTSSIGSVDLTSSGLGNNVYNLFFMGMDAYTGVDISGTSRFIYHDARLDGPLELTTTAGWKQLFGCGINNAAWVIKARSTVKLT